MEEVDHPVSICPTNASFSDRQAYSIPGEVFCAVCSSDLDCQFISDQCNDGICNMDTLACIKDPKQAGTACVDGNSTTQNDICINGVCQGSTPPPSEGWCTDMDCDDGAFCNGDESCDEENDVCLHSGDPCAEEEECDEENDVCLSQPGSCELSVDPETGMVVSEQMLSFTTNETGDCIDSNYEWTIESDIGSAIDQNGDYIAGINTDCSEAAIDVVEVLDHANGIHAEATVSITCDRILSVINLSNPFWIITPSVIYSSSWMAHNSLLIISAQNGAFDETSALSFEPEGNITANWSIGMNDTMFASIRVSPNAQVGPCRATVTTGSHVVTKKEGLLLFMMPLILEDVMDK